MHISVRECDDDWRRVLRDLLWLQKQRSQSYDFGLFLNYFQICKQSIQIKFSCKIIVFLQYIKNDSKQLYLNF